MVKSIRQKIHLERLARIRGQRRIIKQCITCNNDFSIPLHRKDTVKYCSRKCYAENQKGKQAWNKGRASPFRGVKNRYSEETLRKMRKSAKERKDNPIINYGADHWNWKGGICSENYFYRGTKRYKDWRKKIFKRDNYTCKKCNKRGGNLEAHHIKGFAKYPKLRYVIKNGITLCKECHKIVDKYRN